MNFQIKLLSFYAEGVFLKTRKHRGTTNTFVLSSRKHSLMNQSSIINLNEIDYYINTCKVHEKYVIITRIS